LAVIVGGVSSEVAGVESEAAKPVHGVLLPIPHGGLGHFRTFFRLLATNAMAANARVFEFRNPTNVPVVLTQLRLTAAQGAAGTAQENSLDVHKATAFTVVDTSNATSPDIIARRTSTMTQAGAIGVAGVSGAKSQVQIRGAQAGIAAGMINGTMTIETDPFATLPYNVAAAANTTTLWGPYEVTDDLNGNHPHVFDQNEGFVIRNRVLNVTSYGITWNIECSWAEVPVF
jgi:hypothetical protein